MSPEVLAGIYFFLSTVKILDFIYLFQIKEYRWDRFVSSIHDNKLVQTFITHKKLPAKTPRNLLISSLSFALLVVWTWFIYHHLFILLFALSAFIPLSFAFVYAGVAATGVFAFIKRKAVIAKAAKHISSLPVESIGITGSYGKTTTKDYLYEILSQKFKVAKSTANMNTDVGVALSILENVKKDTRYFIAEMGAYKRGEIKAICDMVRPTYGILTAIGNQHLDLFGSKENLILAKKELLESLPEKGKAYIHVEPSLRDKIVAGIKPEVYFIEDRGPVPNLESCIVLAKHLGMEEELIEKGVERIMKKQKKHAPAVGKKGTIFIDNSYSTNREGFLHTLQILDSYPQKRKILVTPGIIELGKEKAQTYEQIVRALGNTAVTLFTTDKSFISSKQVRVFGNEGDLEKTLISLAGPDTVIAFEGRIPQKIIVKIKTP